MELASGTRLGPYEIVEPLGSGGMGEVYRARDPRLERQVALKILRPEVASDLDRLRRFEREAKTVAALNHPHILTVFDVGTHDGTPYVVTELLEGETLRQVLKTRTPTQSQVLTFAVQIARGLAAAHDKDIVHRDLKPENLFLTTDGRIKILDFGLAKLTAREADFCSADTLGASEEGSTSPGVILGTVAYMSPEQAQAHPLDSRSDIFSFGVVLYEMLAHKHPFLRETAPATLTAIVTETAPDLVSTGRGVPPALAGIVQRCLEKEKQDRFRGTHDLALALEAVLQAPSGAASLHAVEERSPYPGLSAFTEKDGAVFFGREGEVEALWKKLRSRNLLAVIGPSGAGKSSFVRAGVLPARPEGWTAIVCTPGRHPLRRLGQALGPELTGEAEALGELAGFEDPETALSLLTRWRKGHAEALVVVDQLEELFTQSPPESQTAFADLLGRLSKEADVRVLLSLRDDFLMWCHQHEPLARVFSELTPLDTLTPEGLRRAITGPAKKQGYAFEDEALVDEMVDSVEGARGALPLLAFAVSQLWERRDREAKRLTRVAYEEIGGVAGALALHAEQTLERIGLEREPIVRELFRNLVTAQWTRAVADREQLLSVCPEPDDAGRVLDQLIDARLLTSYEAVEPVPAARAEPPGAERHVDRVEVVHESLLKAWPRLVRWQAQDEEGAVLRDQLKQAAHLWEEKGRTSDILWTGMAFQEYQLWRRRYPGALTALEEDFATAMAERAARQRRRRRAIVGAVVAASLAVAAVTGGLWRRARAEALRAEAGKLLALGRTQLEDDPTAALAYTRGSLELWDTFEARRLALEVLWRGPVARVLDLDRAARQLALPRGWVGSNWITISPDGRWLAATSGRHVLIVPSDGGPARALPVPPDTKSTALAFGARSDLLITGGSGASLRLWSLPDLREIRTIELPGVGIRAAAVRGDRILAQEFVAEGSPETVTRVLELPGGELKETVSHQGEWPSRSYDEQGDRTVVTRDRTVALRFLDGTNRLQVLGEVPDGHKLVALSPSGDLVASTDHSGETRIWSTARDAREPLRVLRGPALGQGFVLFDPRGRQLSRPGPRGHVLRDLDEFPDAEPLVFGRSGPRDISLVAYDPGGRWLASGDLARTTIDLWPVAGPRRRVLPGVGGAQAQAFTPDGRWLATCPLNRPALLWPSRARHGRARVLEGLPCHRLAMDPQGRYVVVTYGSAVVFPLGGGPPRQLVDAGAGQPAFDRRGLRVAAVAQGAQRLLRVWDLESGRERIHPLDLPLGPDWRGFYSLEFGPDDRLYAGGDGGVYRLDLPADPGAAVTGEVVHPAGAAGADLSDDGRLLLVGSTASRAAPPSMDELSLYELAARTSRRITSHGVGLSWFTQTPSGRIVVTGSHDGVVRAGPATGEEPHLLLGHQGSVMGLAISPDERWIASSSGESTSVWPMPDVTQPPLHTLPHEELLAKLDALTNLRVVRDPSSPTGWTLDVGPFPGWEDVPTW